MAFIYGEYVPRFLVALLIRAKQRFRMSPSPSVVFAAARVLATDSRFRNSASRALSLMLFAFLSLAVGASDRRRAVLGTAPERKSTSHSLLRLASLVEQMCPGRFGEAALQERTKSGVEKAEREREM